VLVHRPRYRDWSFPKGKVEQGETESEAAVREVLEETSLEVQLMAELGTISYIDSKGRPKVVRYWEMCVPSAVSPVPDNEVDQALWMSLEEAFATLSYEHDRELLSRLLELPANHESVPVLLLRHARAGERKRWTGPDELRPLSRAGERQARRIVSLLEDRTLKRLLSSPAVRCVQTLQPLADARGMQIEPVDALAEGAPASVAETLAIAAASDGPSVLCVHGDVQELLIEELLERGVELLSEQTGFDKGAAWELNVRDGEIISLRYLPAPRSRGH
jgi:8-oxo-dGTP diphosphatase